MANIFYSTTHQRTAQPRSKRLRQLGTAASGGNIIVSPSDDGRIAALQTLTATHTEDIATINSTLTTHGTAISDNASAIATNSKAIAGNASAIATNSKAITANSSAIDLIKQTLADWFTLEGTVLHTRYALASDDTVSSLGVGTDGSDTGSGSGYGRLDSWDNYAPAAGDVLSATLGYDLLQRIENLKFPETDLSGYYTKERVDSLLEGKQPTITDLDTIRSGAALGATALQSFTESDPIFKASAAYGITTDLIANWKAAYGWGDHASAGYASTQSVSNLGDAFDTYKAATNTSLSTLNGTVSGHTSQITTINSTLTTHGTAISDNASAIATNTKAIAGNASAIATNSKAITANSSAIDLIKQTLADWFTLEGTVLHTRYALASDDTVSSLGVGTDGSATGSGSADWGAVPTSIIPTATNAYTLGAEDYFWKRVYANALQFDTNVEGIIDGEDVRVTASLMTFVNDVTFRIKPTVDGSAVATMADISGFTASISTLSTQVGSNTSDIGDLYNQLNGYQPLITSSNKLAYSLISGTPALGTAASKNWTGVAATDTSSLVTADWVNDKLDDLNIPDTDSFAKKDDLDDYFPLAGGQTITGKLTISAAGSLEVQGNAFVFGTLYSGGSTSNPYVTQSWVKDQGYTKNAGTVTSVAIKMNGSVKGTVTSSGTIDLGTVLTAHQSLADYATKEFVNVSINTFSEENLGTAASKGVATSVTSGSTSLVTSGAVYTALSGYAKASSVSKAISVADSLTNTSSGLTDGYINNLLADSINGGTPVHSGNIGGYALKIDGSNNINANQGLKWSSSNISSDGYGSYFCVGVDYSATSALTKAKRQYNSILNVAGDASFTGYRFQLASYVGSYNELYYRGYNNNDSVWKDWKTIAFTDSNVASATKLQTPRTIWGQSFDGTGNVSGALTGVTSITASGAITVGGNEVATKVWVQNNTLSTEGADIEFARNITIGSGGTFPLTVKGVSGQAFIRFMNGATQLGYLGYNGLNTPSWITADGAQTLPLATQAWVSGQFGDLQDTIVGVVDANYLPLSGGTVEGTLSVTGKSTLAVTEVRGTLSVTSSISTQGNITTSYGNITASNGTISAKTITQTSDLLLKSVHSYAERFNVRNIAEAPIAYFTWKDGGDTTEHLGTIAQYWKHFAPQCVYGKEGSMSMDYSTLGLVSSIINAREIVKHESEIDQLKRRVKELEDRLAAYEAA